LAVMLSVAGCHGKQDQNAANQAGAPDQSQDPATANLAPVSATDTNAAASSTAATTQSAPQSSSAGSYDQAPASDSNSDSYEDDYGAQPEETATQAPPPLPEYQQPAAPGDGYIWTPGYWNYAPTGYYWVPGVWVQAPYQGALWTPGYWGYRHNHYELFRGYWGPHIGFYGGVNYGFGYVGVGYQGGYWKGSQFNYNRSVNNVNTAVVHNFYNYSVVNNTTVTRVSFNGGSGGIAIRPRPAELAAWREPHAPPMTTQVQVDHSARTDRAQFIAVNHGHPATAVFVKPVQADHDVRPVPPPPMRMPAPQQQGQQRPMSQQQGQQRPMPQPQGQQRPMPQHPEPGRAEPSGQMKPMPQHTPPQRPQASGPGPQRPEPQHQHAAPQSRPAPAKPSPMKATPQAHHQQPQKPEAHQEPNREHPQR